MSENSVAISACVLARNEEERIEDALRSLDGWTDQIIVIDVDSDDGTGAMAREYTDCVLTVPRAPNVESLRSLAIPMATGQWLFFLDADERVPPRLGPVLQQYVRERGDEFEALCVPFKHYFCGRWMRHGGWWPGYKGPQLLKAGHFHFNDASPSGLSVEGRTLYLPADDEELAIVHHAYEDLDEFVAEMTRDAGREAENLLTEDAPHSWEAQLAHLVEEWRRYYEDGQSDRDGMHGFLLAFLSGFSGFVARAKLWDLRRLRGELPDQEQAPGSIREMLDFMGRVLSQGADPRTEPPAQAAEGAPITGVPLLWRLPVCDASDFADKPHDLLLAVIESREPVAVVPPTGEAPDCELGSEAPAIVAGQIVPADTPAELCVSEGPLLALQPNPNARVNIARARFETDWLPSGSETGLNRFDRIWVPSEFNRETFIQSGVEPNRVAVIPEALDPRPFAAVDLEPWPLPGEEAYRFLSVFDWTLRKGWDVLLTAFAADFGDDPYVGLILKVWSSLGYTLDDIQTQADAHLRRQLGRCLSELPNIHFWRETLPVSELARIYRGVEAFVLPSRGESWCRPLIEAMAAGLPTIATAWGAPTEFHNNRVGYPLACRLVPVSAASARETPRYAGHCWAEPDVAELRRLMRQLVADPQTARGRGLAAKGTVAHQYSRPAVARLLSEELARCRQPGGAPATVRTEPHHPPERMASSIPAPPPSRPPADPVIRDPVPAVRFQELLGRPLRLRWEIDPACSTSSVLACRQFCLGLLAGGDVELTLGPAACSGQPLTPQDDARLAALEACFASSLTGPADLTIRQALSPDWSPPEEGKLIILQPWGYSHIPEAWVENGSARADEIWVHSRPVRDSYVRSGVPAEKVHLVPLGFDPDLFRPDGARLALPTEKSLRFLFVGGTRSRKGADLLLAAYREAFTPSDDVCLVVKEAAGPSSDEHRTLAETFSRAQADPTVPEIVYIDWELTDEEVGSLYRACTCVVLPYRAEGFGLPPLEGMACGLPAIVTSGGPTDDYLDDSMALRVPRRRRPAGPGETGGLLLAGDAWQLEPDLEALVGALRWVRDRPDQSRERGERAHAHVTGMWTWRHAVDVARQHLYAALTPPPQEPAVLARLWAEPTPPAATERADGAREGVNELSLCLIARDEERRIARCLGSIAPYVDEMIAVDTGSQDRTREIARDCGARVFDFPWTDSFSEARNQSLAQARGRWVFWMDADDTISPECGRAMRELIRNRAYADAAYQVQVRIPPGPGEFSESVVDHIKLFPNRSDLRFEHRIHEQILPALRRAGLPVIGSDLYVTHQNYDRSPEGQMRKRQRDFRLLDLELRERPGHPFVLFNLGMTHLYATRDYEVAAQYLRRCLDGSDWRDSIVRKAYAMLTTARLRQEEYQAAMEVNQQGRGFYPDDAELLFQAAQIYQQFGQLERARETLERLICGRDEPYFRSVDTGLRTYRGRHELALLFRRRGEPQRAAQLLREIAAAFPHYVPARLDLVETLCETGDREGARHLLAAIPAQPAIEGHLAHLCRLVSGG